MREIDELQPLPAQRLLTIWRESRQAAEEPLERSLLANARVLAECCCCRGEAAFSNEDDVLETLTVREMESLLERLATGRLAEAVNPAFDQKRFRAMQEG